MITKYSGSILHLTNSQSVLQVHNDYLLTINHAISNKLEHKRFRIKICYYSSKRVMPVQIFYLTKLNNLYSKRKINIIKYFRYWLLIIPKYLKKVITVQVLYLISLKSKETFTQLKNTQDR